MKFYRNLHPFKVISFDLDDTLYDNHQVIIRATRAFIESVAELSQIPEFNAKYWHQWKLVTQLEDPIACEDVTEWRKRTLRNLLTHHKKNFPEIDRSLQHSMETFLHWRHQIDVPAQSYQILDQLKKHYALSVISNGNVDATRIGFQQFDLLLQGGKHGRAKPNADLFHQTAEYFKVKPAEILHVGDNLHTDVQGAIQAGCQAVWINLSGDHLARFSDARVLPTVEINDLSELLELI